MDMDLYGVVLSGWTRVECFEMRKRVVEFGIILRLDFMAFDALDASQYWQNIDSVSLTYLTYSLVSYLISNLISSPARPFLTAHQARGGVKKKRKYSSALRFRFAPEWPCSFLPLAPLPLLQFPPSWSSPIFRPERSEKKRHIY